MNQQKKIVLAAVLGFIGGVALTEVACRSVIHDHHKAILKLQMAATHMLEDFSPYVPEEVLTTTREKMEFDAIVIEEEGITQ